jgi:hypothetical protein
VLPQFFNVLAAAEKPDASNDKVVNFSLLDYRGKHFELRRSEARVVVLYFLGLDCPIARQSMGKLRTIQEEFRDQQVAVWLINATPQADPDEKRLDMIAELAANGLLAGMIPKTWPNADETIRRLKSMTKLSEVLPRSMVMGDREEFRRQVLQSRVGHLTLLVDEHQAVTQHFGVERTCEAIAIDTKTMKVIYRGAVDDQMTPGNQKPQPTENYLHDALEQFLAGKPISTPRTTTHGCLITMGGQWAAKPVSYSEQVAPILIKSCIACHSEGQIGPFTFTDYASVKRWTAMMEEVLLDRRMPPWDADSHYGSFANDLSLSSEELATLLTWIKQGAPRGEGEDPLPKIATSPRRWVLGEPDFVVKLPKVEEIPPTGILEYRYLDSSFEMPHDGWVRAAVCRPDNAKVVHHMIVRVKYPRTYRDKPLESYLFTTWAPGMRQIEFPPDTGVFVPKGARFNFEMHYTTNGEPQTDQSEMGLYLAKSPPKMRVEVRAAETRDLQIPPGEADAQHSCMYCFRRDAILYDLSPHMHLRGSWFKFQLLYPDGRRETVLSVPRYDFNWQTGHQFSRPLAIPAGTWLLATGGFDNSARNPSNPDSKKHVSWGLQTADEMFMAFITAAEKREENTTANDSPAGP